MLIDKDFYTKHIKNDEKKFEMRKLLDKIELVIKNHSIEITDFMDPYERLLARSILNRFSDINYKDFGGTSNAERKVICIYPHYFDEKDVSFNLVYLRLKGEIEGLIHKNFLGALLNLGIKRAKTGDIQIHEDHVDIILKSEISNYIIQNLDRVGNKKVSISSIEKEDLAEPQIKYKEISKFIPSMRIDSFLSSAYNISRQDSINIIKFGNVKVNWEEINKPSRELEVGDIISTRGYGRAIIKSIDGFSKKGRLHITVQILI